MKHLSAVLAVAFATTVFAGCLGDEGSSLSLSQPEWKSGYAFSYHTTEKVVSKTSLNGVSSNEDHSAPAIDMTLEVLNTTLDVAGEPIYLLASSSNAPGQHQVEAQAGNGPVVVSSGPKGLDPLAIRQRDLADIPVKLGYTTQCTNGRNSPPECKTITTGLKFGDAPTVTFLDFPLKKGKTWQGDLADAPPAQADSGMIQILPPVQHYDAKVTGPKTVNLPLGSVKTMEVTIAIRPRDLQAAVASAREELTQKDGVKSVSAFEVQLQGQERVYYAEEFQMIARVSVEVTGQIHVAFQTEDGKSMDARVDSKYTQEKILTGARLVERPERSIDQAGRILAGEIALADPTGRLTPPPAYRLSLQADKSVINAAESPEVAFKTAVEGAPSLPTVVDAVWRIVDSREATVASGHGLNFTYKFTAPGLYSAQVDAVEPGNLTTTSAHTEVTANYVKDVPATCGPLFGGCVPFDVPVRTGITKVTVSATPRQAVPLGGGTITLAAPNNKRFTTSCNNADPCQLFVSNFTTTDTGSDWTLSWRPQPGLTQGVAYHVELQFGAAPHITTSAAVEPRLEGIIKGFVVAPLQLWPFADDVAHDDIQIEI